MELLDPGVGFAFRTEHLAGQGLEVQLVGVLYLEKGHRLFPVHEDHLIPLVHPGSLLELEEDGNRPNLSRRKAHFLGHGKGFLPSHKASHRVEGSRGQVF
jgi:hypothetical protein